MRPFPKKGRLARAVVRAFGINARGVWMAVDNFDCIRFSALVNV